MTTLRVPDDLAARLAAEAARRGIDVDELTTELLKAGLVGQDQLPASSGEDPLEAFIGSGRSGRHDVARRHRELKAEVMGDRPARDL